MEGGRSRRFLLTPGPLFCRAPGTGSLAEPSFRHDVLRARELRADLTFGESILDIADDAENDWTTAQNGRPIVNKEIVLRSKIRIEARQFHMSRLHHSIWGDHKSIDVKDDWALLSKDERRRRADELIVMIAEIRNPPPGPPPLVYRWEEAPEEAEPGRVGWQPRSATGREG